MMGTRKWFLVMLSVVRLLLFPVVGRHVLAFQPLLKPSTITTSFHEGSAHLTRRRQRFHPHHRRWSFLRVLDENDDTRIWLPHKQNQDFLFQGRSLQSRRQFLMILLSMRILSSPFIPVVTTRRNVANAVAAGEEGGGNSFAVTSSKILVLGGTGFVGSCVVNKLKSMGVHDVVVTSRDGRNNSTAFDVTQPGINIQKEIEYLAKGYTAVISCIGSIGTPNDDVVNSATGLAAVGAKSTGTVNNFVYISVAPEMKELVKDITFLKPYMNGKQFSEDKIISTFPSGSYTLIEPSFIDKGGVVNTFNGIQSRVSGFYGEFIETLLSSESLIKSVSNKNLGDNVVKTAAEPAVSVDSVAGAAIAGALGWTQGILDTHGAITEIGSKI